jgi:hypothetical protein
VLFADDLVLASAEGDLQQFIYNLNTVATKYNMEMSTEKTKILVFQGKELMLSKVFIGNIIQRVSKFTYLGYTLSCVDTPNKAAKYTKTKEVINNILKPSLVQIHFIMLSQNFGPANCMLQKQSVDSKRTRS